MIEEDIIVALATPHSENGAIAVIRLSGTGTIRLVNKNINIIITQKNDKNTPSVESFSNNSYIPHEDDEIYAKITNIQGSFAYCEIFATKEKLITPLQGLIKHDHIKDEYKDFDIYDCFLPGDIILGKIISIDQSNYIYISTRDKLHGVVFAKSKISNEIMMPISFDKMQCLYTNCFEQRKVAIPELIK